MRQIIHIDMDAFYASVEQLDEPTLRGKPVIVGGPSKRGVVAAASYEARRYGVHSAMPLLDALRRCPGAMVRSPRGARYQELSRQIFTIFSRYTPLVEGLSLDEAFLDVTDSRRLFGDGTAIATLIRADIKRELGLTASAGVAANKFVAKIASDLKKPDALVVVEGPAAPFLSPLPVERMWGIGPAAGLRLRGAGLRTLGDLARADPARLSVLLGSFGPRAAELAQGLDDRPVIPATAPKSLGAEQTFEEDLRTRAELERALLAQAVRVAGRLMRRGLYGQRVSVKLKYADFRSLSRQRRLPEPVSDTDSIFEAARDLLGRFPSARPVRLTGVAVSDLTRSAPAPGLFPNPEAERRARVQQAVSLLDGRFGAGGLTRATLIDPPDKK